MLNPKHSKKLLTNRCKTCKKDTNNPIFCSLKCQAIFRQQEFNKLPIEKLKVKKRRQRLLALYGNQCMVCKNTEWRGKPIYLEEHHLDGNSANNTKKNLQLLCPNCHTLTPTYKAKNKGKGTRQYRRTRYALKMTY